MEDHAVVVALLREFDKIFASLGTIFEIQQQMNIAHGCLQDNFVLFLGDLQLHLLQIVLSREPFIDNVPGTRVLILQVG